MPLAAWDTLELIFRVYELGRGDLQCSDSPLPSPPLPHQKDIKLNHRRIPPGVFGNIILLNRFQLPAQFGLYVSHTIPYKITLHRNAILHLPCEENRALSSRRLLEHALLHSTTLDADPERTEMFQDPSCTSSHNISSCQTSFSTWLGFNSPRNVNLFRPSLWQADQRSQYFNSAFRGLFSCGSRPSASSSWIYGRYAIEASICGSSSAQGHIMLHNHQAHANDDHIERLINLILKKRTFMLWKQFGQIRSTSYMCLLQR